MEWFSGGISQTFRKVKVGKHFDPQRRGYLANTKTRSRERLDADKLFRS
jgi:hypothetical protein